jgi:putative ABC transport system permease protein
MFRNYLVTALRNLARNWLYASISIFGLAVAFAGAILIAQFVRNEFTYDRWIPDYQHIYTVTSTLTQTGQPPQPSDMTQGSFASQLKVAFPKLTSTRLDEDFPTLHQVAGDDGIVDQAFAWADPNIFDVLQLPALAGDLKTALQQPDTVVMTRRAARTYFGQDLPIGRTLDLQSGTDHHPMRVTAILKDLPSNTSLVAEIYASGKSSYSQLAFFDLHPSLGNVGVRTLIRAPAGTTIQDLRHDVEVTGRPETAFFQTLAHDAFTFAVTPLADAHLTPPGLTNIVVKPVGSPTTALAIATVGLLIVLVAAINFVTLMTARATRRAAEVGIRKVNGASRGDLIVQFLGEALIYAVLSILIATGLASLLFKPFSAFVQRGLSLDFVHDPTLALSLVAATLVIGLLGGLYPAFVLSGFKPAAVLKGGLIQTAGSQTARQALVVVQFAILIGLILGTVTIYRQTQYALNQGMGAKRDLIVQIWGGCNKAFPDEIARLPGVAAVACSSQTALNVPFANNITPVRRVDGGQTSFNIAGVDFGFFELYGIKPLAGRLFDRAHGADNALAGPGGLSPPPEPGAPPPTTPPPASTVQPPVILNETAVRALGYPSPSAAVGKSLPWSQFTDPNPNAPIMPSEIVGVVPDLPTTVQGGVNPTFYFIVPRYRLGMASVRMTGDDMPGAVRAIARTWKATGNIRPIQEMFLAQYRRTQYLDIIIQGATIAICAAAAIVIACLGLFALSAYTTERRTKEIGIRKVMGASTLDVVRLLVGQFTVPVLWAILIACPLGYLLMDHWLKGFASHVSLPLWSLALAAGVALVVAWLTVSLQSFKAARAKPILALRYE